MKNLILLSLMFIGCVSSAPLIEPTSSDIKCGSVGTFDVRIENDNAWISCKEARILTQYAIERTEFLGALHEPWTILFTTGYIGFGDMTNVAYYKDPAPMLSGMSYRSSRVMLVDVSHATMIIHEMMHARLTDNPKDKSDQEEHEHWCSWGLFAIELQFTHHAPGYRCW